MVIFNFLNLLANIIEAVSNITVLSHQLVRATKQFNIWTNILFDISVYPFKMIFSCVIVEHLLIFFL